MVTKIGDIKHQKNEIVNKLQILLIKIVTAGVVGLRAL